MYLVMRCGIIMIITINGDSVGNTEENSRVFSLIEMR